MSPTRSLPPSFEILQQIIRQRKTVKVLAAADAPLAMDGAELQMGHQLLDDCIATAGWAPFHYDRGMEGVPEPWRFYVLYPQACRELASRLPQLVSMKPTSKIPALLRGCCACVLVTWWPQNQSANADLSANKLVQVNAEHLAATSSAVQNLLLLAESLGWQAYWSSGAPLGTSSVFDCLGIDNQQHLLAAVFLQYQPSLPEGYEVVHGKLRGRRSQADKWCRKIRSLA